MSMRTEPVSSHFLFCVEKGFAQVRLLREHDAFAKSIEELLQDSLQGSLFGKNSDGGGKKLMFGDSN